MVSFCVNQDPKIIVSENIKRVRKQKGIKNTIIEIKKGELIENLKEAENDV